MENPNGPVVNQAPNPAIVYPNPTTNSPTPNTHPPHIKKAHNFLFLYIGLLLAAVLAGAVYAWQNGQVKDVNKKLAATTAQNAVLKKQLADAVASIPSNTNAGNAPNNPYAGWKTFCDNFSDVCLRYPKDWDIAGSTSSTKTTETLTNSTNSAVVSYDNPLSADKQEQVYYVADIQELTIKSLGIKIVGRTIGSSPGYVLIDSTYLTNNHISIGQSHSFVNNATFTTNAKSVTARLMATPTGSALSNIKTSDQAAAWFKTDDAKISLKILQSLYYQ